MDHREGGHLTYYLYPNGWFGLIHNDELLKSAQSYGKRKGTWYPEDWVHLVPMEVYRPSNLHCDRGQ